MDLSQKIQKILDEVPGLTQAELGRLAGASKSVVNQWLKGGIKSIDLKYAMEIWRKLGYSAWWLILDRGEPKYPFSEGDTPEQITDPGVGQEELKAISRLLVEKGKTIDDLRKAFSTSSECDGQFPKQLEDLIPMTLSVGTTVASCLGVNVWEFSPRLAGFAEWALRIGRETAGGSTTDGRFTRVLTLKIAGLTDDEMWQLENLMRVHLKLDPLPPKANDKAA